MKKAELTKIIKFIESEIHGYDIDFDYEIEDEVLGIELNGSFTSDKPIKIDFRILEDKVNFYAISENWQVAETREFWITFMAKIYE